MISCRSQSDAGIRQIISLVTQICLSDEFQALRAELSAVYVENGHENGDILAFEDALYAMLMQYEDLNPDLKELIAGL